MRSSAGIVERKTAREGVSLGGRAVLFGIGVFLSQGRISAGVLPRIVGVAGVLLSAAAIGLVEIGMALWYRTRRTVASRRSQP